MKRSTKNTSQYVVCFLCTLLLISCLAPPKEKNEDLAPSLFAKISETELLNITLQTDFELLFKNKSIEGKHFQSASIIVEQKDSLIYKGKVKIRPRGVTRRDMCTFPPIMLKTKKKEEKQQNLGPTHNIKLVTNCEDSLAYDKWVVKEQLIYKMLNTLSKESFSTQRVEVTYEDSEHTMSMITKMGFIIEPLEELSKRCDCEILDENAAVKNIHKEHYKLITFFQFMIGNTDWNLSRRHNIQLLNCFPEYGPTPVPYDFDFSGFVNASYAKPHAMLPIEKVTDRMLQWRGDIDEDFSNTVAIFNENKSALTSIIEQESELTNEEKENSLLYLESFYDIISSEESIKTEIIKARAK